MDREKALDKIKKCLALSKSANEHEAAQALKQAQALMKRYGIDEQEVELSSVNETQGVVCAQIPPLWQKYLASVVCSCFGVRSYMDYRYNPIRQKVEGLLKFFGISPRAELAEYAYTVLLRQIKKHRAEYMKNSLAKVRLVKNKTFRADEFCIGWIFAVQRKVDVFANGEREMLLLQKWGEANGLTVAVCKEHKGKSLADRAQGWERGRDVGLHHAVNGAGGLKQIGG